MLEKITYTSKITKFNGESLKQNLPIFNVNIIVKNTEINSYLMIDTGSNGSMIFTKLIRDIDFNEELSSIIQFKKIDNKDCNFTFKFRHDNLTTKDDVIEDIQYIGIIGQDFLSVYSLEINFLKNYFSISNKSSINFEFNSYFFLGNFLIIKTIIDKFELNLMYDTGMSGDILLFENCNKDFLKDIKTNKVTKGIGALGFTYEIEHSENLFNIELNKRITFKSSLKIMKMNKMIEGLPFDGLLGFSVFANHKICIDYKNKYFYVKYNL